MSSMDMLRAAGVKDEDMKPYHRVLTREQVLKADKLALQMKRNLTGRFKLWVRKTNDEDDLTDGVRWPYTITVTGDTTTDELMDVVARFEKKHGFDKDDSDDENGDEEKGQEEISATALAARERARQAAKRKKEAGMVLVYAGEVLRRGEKLKDYPLITEKGRWSKPFAGVLWLCPAHLAPGFVRSNKWKTDRRDLA